MPPAGIRLAGEAVFLVLVAVGLALGEFDPIVIGAVMVAALLLVALFERASRKEAARATEVAAEEPLALPPPMTGDVESEPTVDVADLEPTPEATVNERSARAILASGPPPLPGEVSKPKRMRRFVERRPDRSRSPAPEGTSAQAVPVSAEPAREWNLWELERAVRDSPDEKQREEWNALLMHLRQFANADGDLPVEFDRFVRESFAAVLDYEREPAARP